MRGPIRLLALVAAVACLSEVAIAQKVAIRPLIGGLPADSGFALGAEFFRPRLVGSVDGRAKILASLRRYLLLEAGAEVPHLGPWLYLGVGARYRNFPEEDFWGIGPNTPESARTDFLYEDVDASAVLGTAFGRFRMGVTGGYVRIHTGPGRDGDLPSVPPRLLSSPRYVHGGPYLEYKSLDSDRDPSEGGRYGFTMETFGGQFERFVIDLRRFVPIKPGQTMAFRILTTFTDQSSSQPIPFFMLPTAGGIDTVRGFDQYRFRDVNAMVLNAEYRRPGWKFLDVVAFVDAGRVFANPANLGLQDLHPSAGGGTRIKFGGRVFMGIDLAVSNEGFHLWFRSSQTF